MSLIPLQYMYKNGRYIFHAVYDETDILDEFNNI